MRQFPRVYATRAGRTRRRLFLRTNVMILVWPGSAAPHRSASRNRAAIGPRAMPRRTAGTAPRNIRILRPAIDGEVGRTGFAKVPGSLDLDREEPEQDDKGPEDADCDVKVTDVEGRHLRQRQSAVVGERESEWQEGVRGSGNARFFFPSLVFLLPARNRHGQKKCSSARLQSAQQGIFSKDSTTWKWTGKAVKEEERNVLHKDTREDEDPADKNKNGGISRK